MRTIKGLFARGVPFWGIGSLLLLVGYYVLWEYNFRLEDLGQQTLFSRVTGYKLCFSSQLAAAVCGIIAMRRESVWWVITVVPAAWLALGCSLGEL